METSVTRPAAIALAVFVLVEAVYLATTCPSYFLVDCPELNAAAAEWGVPHPPGYPLYTMLGGLAIRVLPFADAGFCMNLMTGFFAALAAVAVLGMLRRLTGSVWVAAAGATTLAFGASVWSMATVSEVYTLELALLAAFLAGVTRVLVAADTVTGTADAGDADVTADSTADSTADGLGAKPKWLAIATLCFGFALAHRNVTVLFGPVLLYAALTVHGRALFQPKRVVGLLLLALAPLAVYLYLPLAASRDPIINIGEPTSLARLWDVTSGKAFTHLLLASDDPAFYLKRFWLYLANLPKELGVLLLLLPFGVRYLGQKHRAVLACVVYVLLVNIAWSVAYNIYDIQTHVLPSLLAFTVLGASGLAWLLERWTKPPFAIGSAIGLVLANALLLVFWNWAESDRRANTIGPRFAADVLAPVEEKSVVLSRIAPTTYVLWAGQILDGVKPGVANIDPSFASEWFSAQLARRFGPSLGLDVPQDARGRDHFAFQLIVRNAARLPVYLGASLKVFFDDPGAMRELRGRWTSVPLGLLHLVVPEAELAPRRDALIDRNIAYWKATLPAFRALPRVHEDHETISVKLRYAQGLFDAARFCAASGRNADACEFLSEFAKLDVEARTSKYNTYWHERGYTDRDAPPYAELGRRMLADLRDRPARTAPPPPSFELRYVQAVDLLRTGQFDEARTALLALQKSRPDSIEVKFSLACVSAEKKEHTGAIRMLEEVLQAEPGFDAAYPVLAELYIQTKQIDRAAETVERFLQVRPGDPAALQFRGRIEQLRRKR